jgi:phenol/toluene 2-monooxygenase (NADH) P0/A0
VPALFDHLIHRWSGTGGKVPLLLCAIRCHSTRCNGDLLSVASPHLPAGSSIGTAAAYKVRLAAANDQNIQGSMNCRIRRPPMQAPTLLSDSPPPEPEGFDLTRCFVRFRALNKNGFVEFDFAIGDPSLSVELVMKQADYAQFCETNHALVLGIEEGAALDRDQMKWRFGQPGLSE